MKKVIITGADGFIGSCLAQKFMEHKMKVVAVGRKSAPKRLAESEYLRYVQADIFAEESLREKLPCDDYEAMIHLAWSGVSGEEKENYELQMKNALATVACLKVSKEIGCKRFVCGSSVAEKEVMTIMNHPEWKPRMAHCYGIGKLTAHAMCKAVAASLEMDMIWVVLANVYGVGDLSDCFISVTSRKMMNESLLQFTAATQNYDFIYIDDVANGLYLAALQGKESKEYFIGSGKARKLRNYIEDMKAALCSETELRFGETAFTGIDLPMEVYSIDELERDTGFKPEIEFEAGIKKTYDWLKKIMGERS